MPNLRFNWFDKLTSGTSQRSILIQLKTGADEGKGTDHTYNPSSTIRQTSNTIIWLNYFRYRFWFQIWDVTSTFLGFWREWAGRIGGHAAKTGRFALFLPWVETKGYQTGYSAGVFKEVCFTKDWFLGGI